MTRSWLIVCCVGCGGGSASVDAPPPTDIAIDMPPPVTGNGNAKMLNGATPGTMSFRGFAAPIAPIAESGDWVISPDQLHVPITAIELEGMGNASVTAPLVDCSISFDLAQFGLAQTLECPFTLPAGTYTSAAAVWDSTFDILINDDVDDIYTDPTSTTLLNSTAPTAGAQYVTVPNPQLGVQSATPFAQPLVVATDAPVTISILLNALQSLIVNVNGATLTFGPSGNGMPGFPNAIITVGTPEAIGYYANHDLGTASSYRPTVGTNPFAISVLYATTITPAFLGMPTGTLPGCGPIAIGLVSAGKGNGYLGLDSTGVLGWANFSDTAATMYSTVMKMPQVSALAATTTFECLDTTTDPMPPGDSFESGAPVIPTPTRTDVMTLVAD